MVEGEIVGGEDEPASVGRPDWPGGAQPFQGGVQLAGGEGFGPGHATPGVEVGGTDPDAVVRSDLAGRAEDAGAELTVGAEVVDEGGRLIRQDTADGPCLQVVLEERVSTLAD